MNNIIKKKSFISLSCLKKLGLVFIFGKDCLSFLNNQLTMNINLLKKKKFIHCVYCNKNGKVLVNLYLFHYNIGYLCIVRKSLINIQIKNFKKYAIFSKVSFTIKKKKIFGISGTYVRLFLLKFFNNLPNADIPIIKNKKITILWIKKPKERFLFIISNKQIVFFKNIFNSCLFFDVKWDILNLKCGIPIINKNNVKRFFPQSINLNSPNNIDMNKGCYLGQEVISKIIFRKINKRYLSVLEVVKKDICLDLKNNTIRFINKDKKIIVGNVLYLIKLNNNILWIQIVLNKYVSLNSLLLCNDYKGLKFLVKYTFCS